MSQSNSELVIGLVGPLGSDLQRTETILKEQLQHYRYTIQTIRFSELIEELEPEDVQLENSPADRRYHTYMDGGNKLRDQYERGDILAQAAITRIAMKRDTDEVNGQRVAKPIERTAHVLRSLKHPEEARMLRAVYGHGFFLIGVHSPRSNRLNFLKDIKNITEDAAKDLLDRDEAELDPLGQQTRKTFQLADAFILSGDSSIKQIDRLLKLMFSHPYTTPTKDEYSMYLAYSASLRSGDLSRQVGAVIMSKEGDLISTGANDVPRAHGGLYWSDSPEDKRDHSQGYDSNEQQKHDMINKLMENITNTYTKLELSEPLLEKGMKLLEGTGFLDITEYGRAVHAEMEALLSCTRVGISPRNGILYCTTFPCHNCAKHIVASGIKRVVYIEPYPKSQALSLHGDAIELEGADDTKVTFEPFIGIGPSRFMDLFSMRLSAGSEMVRKQNGKIIDWKKPDAQLRVPLSPNSYLDNELLLVVNLTDILENQSESDHEQDEPS